MIIANYFCYIGKMLTKVSPFGVIFFSISPVNIDHYDLQVKTSMLTPSELKRNIG